jgi:hypothetical protein
MSNPNPAKPNGRQKLVIAERAAVSLRTVDAYFIRKTQHANTLEHIERALRELGLERLIRHDERRAA